jgi:methionine-S-sulfoxide reductase
MKILAITLLIVFSLGGYIMINQIDAKELIKQEIPTKAEVATFSGGCFWCSESAFQEQPGVYEVISGYVGGDEINPTYAQVSSGQTSHKEGVQVYYNSNNISYEKLLEIYWQHINPTQEDGQFGDKGSHYTTAIFYNTEEEKSLAEQSKQDLEESEKFDKPIVTQVLPFKNFYKAEEYHQGYYLKQSGHYNLYAVGSGRKGFIEKVWKKE